MHKPIIVHELGINCNGSLEIAKKLIDNAIETGADFVKFQKRTIDLVYSKEELDKSRESPWGTTTRQQKEGLEFNKEQYQEIDNYCKSKGISWFASPWDTESLKFLVDFDIPYIKIPSALNTNLNLLNSIKETKIPVIISTGMTSKEELDSVISILEDQIKFILSCTSTYPSKDEEMNLKRILTLKEIYGDRFRIGFSNHHPGITYIIASAALGAEMIEFHTTLDRSMYGSDQAASIEKTGCRAIQSHINSIVNGWGDGKIGCIDSEVPIMKKLRK